MLARAINEAKFTDPLKVARALEDMKYMSDTGERRFLRTWPALISDEARLVIPAPRGGTRNPEAEIERTLESGFCPHGQPRVS